MLKIITWILTKKEKRLSKKQKTLWSKATINKELQLYRCLLDEIDKYNYEVKNITTLRHYRYKTFKIVDSVEKVKD